MKAVLFPGDRQVVSSSDRPRAGSRSGAGAGARLGHLPQRHEPLLRKADRRRRGHRDRPDRAGHEPAGRSSRSVMASPASLQETGSPSIWRRLRQLRVCRGGYLFLCPTGKCVGFDVDGGNADYIVVPAGTASRCPTRSVSRWVR